MTARAATGRRLSLGFERPAMDLLVVRVGGESDAAGAAVWARTLAMAHLVLLRTDPRGRARLVCDVAELTVLGADGLGVLVGAAVQARADGIELRIVGACGGTRRALAQGGLVHHLAPEDRPTR